MPTQNYLDNYMLLVFVILCATLNLITCQIINRAPQFVPGSGDMSRFSLSENTPVGSPVYQLRGMMINAI